MTNEVAKITSHHPLADNPQVRALLDGVLTTDRDAAGRNIIRRRLVASERAELTKRGAELADALVSGRYQEIAKAVTQLLAGFPSTRATEQEAAAIVAQYATSLRGLTTWAVERACGRFARGEVSAEEVGAKRLDRKYPPSSAEVRVIAEKIERPWRMEAWKIGRLLGGSVEMPEASAAERNRVATKFEALKNELAAKIAVTDLEEREKAARRIRERGQRALEDEYRREGLEPVVTGGMVTSLALLRQQGWTIQDVGKGQRALVAPAPTPKYEPAIRENS